MLSPSIDVDKDNCFLSCSDQHHYKHHLSYSQPRTATTSNLTHLLFYQLRQHHQGYNEKSPRKRKSRRKSRRESRRESTSNSMGEASAGVWALLVIGKFVSKA
jgi:hypothetical protein